MAITFPVSEVDAGRPMTVIDRAAAIRALLEGPSDKAPRSRGAPSASRPAWRIEATWKSDAPLVSAMDTHALAQAAHDAFYLHHPLDLSPDAVWFCLAQGFAHHMALNAETLRDRFVTHQGKEKLVVVRSDFFLGQPNPWPEAFAAFSDQIAARIGRARDLVVADFSTTGPVERAASEVLLMDAFQAYFEYEMLAGCGIPAISLLGTVEDWRSVRRRAAMLSEYGLEWWTDALLPVLDELIRTAEGHVDPSFWRSFFRYQSGSGPSELTGWINVLFPYLWEWSAGQKRLARSDYLSRWEEGFRTAQGRTGWLGRDAVQGPSLGMIPGSLASAPVRFVDVRDGSVHPLRFVAGIFGVTQSAASRALSPEFGWAIVHEPGEP